MSTIHEVLETLRLGKMVILVDEYKPESEGYLIMAAPKITPEVVNFILNSARGTIHVVLTEERASELNFIHIINSPDICNNDMLTVPVYYSTQAKSSSGDSVVDRTTTILALADKNAHPEYFRRPGQILPLIAKRGGVLFKANHIEATVDLLGLVGLNPVGVCCTILKEDGDTAKLADLEEFASLHDLQLISISEIIAYRLEHEKLISREAETTLPNWLGVFKMWGYRTSYPKPEEHVALIYGDIKGKVPLVRVHSECLTGDAFGSYRCDCGEQLHKAMEMIVAEGFGVILYLKQEGRGIGLVNKLKAYQLQDQGLDTIEANLALGFKADLREYGIGAQILADIGLTKIRLLTNNPRKIVGLDGYGLEVVERVPIIIPARSANQYYMDTKEQKMGHWLK